MDLLASNPGPGAKPPTTEAPATAAATEPAPTPRVDPLDDRKVQGVDAPVADAEATGE